jgi:hypothetical protein
VCKFNWDFFGYKADLYISNVGEQFEKGMGFTYNDLKPILEKQEWLNSFAHETICANFKHKGERIIKDNKGERECYRRNNERNRCVYTKQKAQGEHNMDYLEDLKRKEMDLLSLKSIGEWFPVETINGLPICEPLSEKISSFRKWKENSWVRLAR